MSAPRSRETRRAGSVSSASRSGPSRRNGRWSSVSTGPCHCVASMPPAPRTSQGRPTRDEPIGPTCHRPFIRRWLRTVTPPSNLSTRCLPIASTFSSRRPSTAAATPVASPLGCGEAATRWCPMRGRSRTAARWRESPSGTASISSMGRRRVYWLALYSRLRRGAGFRGGRAERRPCAPCLTSSGCYRTTSDTAMNCAVAAATTSRWKISWYPNVNGNGFGQWNAYVIAPTV